MASVIVLAGGMSDEREVSLRSGQSVARALEKAGHQVSILDPAEGLDEQLAALLSADAVFPALHGLGGEDGSLQQFLEQHNITYVGSDSQASRLCFFKDLGNEVLVENNIVAPENQLVDCEEFQQANLAQQPYVLKPNDGGSSIDTFIVRDIGQAPSEAIQEAFDRHGKLILQELVAGIEVTVPVLGEEALPVIEIIPPADQEFDYENKYNGATQELCPPQNVTDAHQQEAQELALKVHQAFGCRDLSRSDFILTADGKFYALEINTLPGMTDQSLVPRSAAVAGYDMAALCDQLVQLALGRAS